MYDEDLAYVQHAGYGDFARRAAPGLLAMLRAARLHGGTVVDLGCGAGVWLRELVRARYDARGIDRSRALVRLAKQTAPGADVRVGSLWTTPLPDCQAVTAIGEVLSYCAPGGGAPPRLSTLFARVGRALCPGGLFVFDVMVEGPPMAYRTWTSGPDWAVLAEVGEDRRRHRLTREITTFRRAGRSGYRRRQETHVQRVVSRGEVEDALRAVGFRVRALRRYGDFELAPRRMAFRARKR